MEIIFVIGRILLGGYFVMMAFNHFKDSESMAGYAKSKNVPMPKIAVIGTGVLMALGGLGIVLGAFPQLAILLLILFLLPTTFMMHDFWNAEGQEKQMEMINFTKNLALVGALIMLLALSTPWLASVGL
ncbi:MAG: DoxX family protein [Candidatus Paceibacterota bacterium]